MDFICLDCKKAFKKEGIIPHLKHNMVDYAILESSLKEEIKQNEISCRLRELELGMLSEIVKEKKELLTKTNPKEKAGLFIEATKKIFAAKNEIEKKKNKEIIAEAKKIRQGTESVRKHLLQTQTQMKERLPAILSMPRKNQLTELAKYQKEMLTSPNQFHPEISQALSLKVKIKEEGKDKKEATITF